MQDLRRRATRGGLARLISQASTLLLRTGSLMVMARILAPADFGLVGMVTAMIGIFSVFRDFGLSSAAVQRPSISAEQSSTLFWINLLVGISLASIATCLAPFVADFYHQRQLIPLTAVLSLAFVFNAAGVQHTAILERQMRFVTLSAVDIISLGTAVAVGITMAFRGWGYWALVATTTVTPLMYSTCVWLITRWIPGRPRRGTGIRSMMRFGGTLTLGGLVSYFAQNADKILLGRFCGAYSLGIYGRGYQLVNIPTDNLNSAAGSVVFAALSRLQGEPERLRNYFLKGYSLVLSLTIPIAFTSALFAGDIIHLFLGAKWESAIPVFRILVPVTLGFAMLKPTSWLLSSCGLVLRNLKIASVLAPLLLTGYALGLHWGPTGVAAAYSMTMMVAVFPLVAWATRGTPVSVRDMALAVGRPMLSGAIAGAGGFAYRYFGGGMLPPVPRLLVGLLIVGGLYLWMLLFVMGQKQLYFDIARSFFGVSPRDRSLAATL